MRMAYIIGSLALASCHTARSRDAVSNRAKSSRAPVTIREDGVGPIDADTPNTPSSLRALFPDYEVKAIETDHHDVLDFDIYMDDDKLLHVVGDEGHRVLQVNATSSKVGVSDRPWRVGQPFHGSAIIDSCECCGLFVTCFKGGEHVAVHLERSCEGLNKDVKPAEITVTSEVRKALDGVRIDRVIWSPSPLGTIHSPVEGPTDVALPTPHSPCID